MLKTTSANRATRMKVIEDGKVVKTISNASINYGQDLVQLKKMIEIAIRLSPDDPIYTVEKLIISAGDGAEYEIDQKELELIQSTLFRPDTAVPVGAKIQLTVHVKRPAQRSVSRSGATMRERMTSSTVAKEEVPPASSKYENLLRAPSPAPSRRTSTPSKVRSVSRGRVTTTPGNNFRGPSPARFSRCSVSSNDSDNTSRVANRLRDVIPDGMIGRMGSQDSFGSTRSEKFEPSLRVPSTETKMVNNPPSSASKPPPVPQSVESKNTMPPPAPANEPKPATIEPFPESLNDKKTPVKSKRLSVVDLTEENRKNIEMSIHQTWKEVESAPGVKTPPRSFLGPFSYYSPMMSPANQEDDYVSCAGDMGADDHHPMTISATDLPTVDEASNVEETLNTSAQDISEITEAPDSLESTENTSEVANEASSKTNSSSTTANNGTPKKVAPNSAMKSKKSFIQSNVASASKPKNPSNRTSQVGAGAIRPVFPDGKTLGESASSYDHSLRSYSGVNRLTHSEMKKPVSKNDFSPPFAKGHRRTGSFHKESHKDGEGRPSIGTITTQWEFMRINFLNNSDEELEWLMVSKKTGAYHYAHKKLENGEDKYFKSLYEIDLYQNRLQVFVPTNAKFSVLLQDLSNYYSAIMAQPKDETTGNQVLASYQKLCNYCEEVKSQDLFTIFTPKFNQSLSALLLNSNENNDKFKLVRKARDLYSLYTTEITMVQNKLIQSRKDSEESLKNIEKWTKREVETDEYLTVMKQQEQVFMEKEFDENYRSLQLMRSYYPNPSTTTDNKSINEMTITELQQEYQLQGGLISYELANELKSNKFLQWIITHPDDIVYANFLNGDKKTYFENLETYDLIELRAISMILPSKFENDNDNKKMEWRNRFMTRLKMLISQYHGEKVKGCWDGANNCRSMVQLPALKPDQLRRSIYYYRTKEQSDVKLKQYNDKLALLEKKKKQLEQAEMEAKEAKEEYNTVLQEMRDPDFLDLYGSEKLASVKDLAKTELNNAEKKRKTLQQDVTRLEKSIEDTPMSRDQFIEKEKELQDYLKEVKEIDWTVPGTAPVLIDGVFEPDRVIEKQVKAAAKFLSAEEEAEQRRLELLSFKAKSVNGNSIDTESVDAESAVSPTPEITLAAPSTASQSVDDMISNQNDILNTLTNENNAPVTPMANPLTSPTRKTSILTSTNPDLINTLNKMLSGATKQDTPTGSSILRPKSVSRRSTMGAIFNRTASASSEDTNSENSAANSLPKEKKTTKSKLLKRLLQPFGSKAEGDSENSNPNKALARPPMSFLDQIKARASGKPAQAATASEESEVSTSAEPPMMKPKNPMFAAFGGGGGEGMSFLDQIKSRRKVEE